MKGAIQAVGIDDRRADTSAGDRQSLVDIQVARRGRVLPCAFHGQGVLPGGDRNRVCSRQRVGFLDGGAQRTIPSDIRLTLTITGIGIQHVCRAVDDEVRVRGSRAQAKLCEQDRENDNDRKRTDQIFCHDLLQIKKACCVSSTTTLLCKR